MKTHTIAHSPKFTIFLKFWLLILFVMLLMGAIFYLFLNQGEPLTDYLKSSGLILFILPLINGIIGALNGRTHTFTITEVDDTAYVANWAVGLLQKNGMRIKSKHQNQTVLEPTSSFLRWLGNRFGTEEASISFTENEVIIAGNGKCVDVVDTKVKFGRVAFQNQPYNHS
ncbi:hypothetical protein ABID22_001993 [Pontibacter aydingkolensis]|uniref:Uncharacterized protein n=1 Tax=Pontibacter aydingkolensis TaxID=1911536 RepID=A0ABS7CUS8_9BACT|nr:hypothetical protein [Pontibacter aydingkolensis]MBW7467609.1 hypothetical protein [Pontibacter aydingkolensis]